MRYVLASTIGFALLSAPVAASAEGPGARALGSFGRKSGLYEQSAAIKASPGGYVGTFSVGNGRGCGGALTAPGKATGPSTLVFTKTDSGQTCRITVRYTPNFRTIAITEDSCILWHGVSCEFEGKLQRIGR